MDTVPRLHIDLFNFEDEKFEGSSYVLTSPRSLEACSRLAIKPVELLPKRISEFKEDFLPQGVPIRTVCRLYKEYERERQNKLHLCIEGRQRIIAEDLEEQNVRDVRDWGSDVELSFKCNSAGDASSLEEFSDEEAADHGSVERARTAWTTGIGHRRLTKEELDRRALELHRQSGKSRSLTGRKKSCRSKVRCASRRTTSRNISRSNSLTRSCSAEHLIRRCQSDLGDARHGSRETLVSDGGSVDCLWSHCKRRPGAKLTLDNVGPVTDPLVKRRLGDSLTSSIELRAKDQKILSALAAKRAKEEELELLRESAHRVWNAEQKQLLKASHKMENRRRRSLAQQHQKQEQHNIELAARRELAELESQREKEEQVEKTLTASLKAANRQHIMQMQWKEEKQKHDADRKAALEQRLEQQRVDDTMYKDELIQWQQQKMEQANACKAVNERQLASKIRRNNRVSQLKHELKMREIRHQSLDDRVNLRRSLDFKEHKANEQLTTQRQQRHQEIQRRQKELDERIQRSQQKQQLMEEQLQVWRTNLLNYRKMQEMQIKKAAKETTANKSKTASTLRLQKEKQHRVNVKKLAEKEEKWKNEVETTIAEKQNRVRKLEKERENMMRESRALAGASERLRDQLKTNNSLNDLDQLGKHVAVENHVLFKQQHYISRYNPLTTSNVLLG